jgi:hypothetical protein
VILLACGARPSLADGSCPDFVKSPGETLVDMRADQLYQGEVGVSVWQPSARCLGRKSFFGDVGKQLLVRAIGDAPMRHKESPPLSERDAAGVE